MARTALHAQLGADKLIQHSLRLLSGIEDDLAEQSLAYKYAPLIYGGWERPDGAWITAPHTILLRFHEARKALFCPCCTRCNRYRHLCQCGSNQSLCWQHLGQAPKDEDAAFECPVHSKLASVGSIPWRRALLYSTVALLPANKTQKTTGMLAELCASMSGRRPWDDTLSAPPGHDRLFVIICQTLQTSSQTTIEPMLDDYLRGRHKAIRNSSHGISYYTVRTPFGIDRLKVMSQDQLERTAAMSSPGEGVNPYEIAWDEPMRGALRATMTRGLLPSRTAGWGREMMAATLCETTDPQAVAFMFNEIWLKAWNRGGRERSLCAITGHINETPVLSEEARRQIIESWPAHEREARMTGVAKIQRGRILSDFDPELHVWDDAQHNVLINDRGEPTSTPMWLSVDPHDVRPWVITYGDISERGHWRVCGEWPEGDFQTMRHYRAAGVDGSFEGYRAVLDAIMAKVPGGKARFRWWCMDPGFGDSEKAGMGQTVRKAMMQQGYWFRTDLPREIEPGHAILRDLMRGSMEEGKPLDELHRPHFQVAASCRNVIWSVMNYVNDEGKDPAKFRERPGEVGKDFVDTLRYVAMCRPTYHDWRSVESDLAASMAERERAMSNGGLG